MAAGTAYFKIVSKARSPEGKYLAVTAATSDDNTAVYVMNEAYGDDYQLWERRSTRNGNGFALINKARGLCIRRTGTDNGQMLGLANVEGIERDDLCVWRTEGPYGGYIAINSFADWEQKFNIPGNGPYNSGLYLISFEWDGGDDNEMWMMIEEAAKVSVKKIDFSVSAGNIQDQDPIVAARQMITNNTGVEQSQTLTFRFTEISTYRFERTTGFSISETIEFSGGIPEISEVKSITTITGSYEYKTGEDKGREDSVEFSFPVRIPAFSTVEAEAIMLRARLDVPYTATFSVEYPGQQPIEKTASGTFINVKAYTVVSKVSPVGTVPKEVKRVTLRRF